MLICQVRTCVYQEANCIDILKSNIFLRPGELKTVDTHKILINAITFYVCLQEIW
jgi:hypothetical protein